MKIFTHWVNWLKKWVMSKEKIVINHYLLTHTVALGTTINKSFSNFFARKIIILIARNRQRLFMYTWWNLKDKQSHVHRKPLAKLKTRWANILNRSFVSKNANALAIVISQKNDLLFTKKPSEITKEKKTCWVGLFALSSSSSLCLHFSIRCESSKQFFRGLSLAGRSARAQAGRQAWDFGQPGRSQHSLPA